MSDVGNGRIDHLMTYVENLDEAGSLFERMGFSLSPVSRIEAMGISNRLVLFRPQAQGQANFIEMMWPHDPSKLPALMKPVLSGRPGTASLVLAAEDIVAFHDRMTGLGFDVPPPAYVTREWKIPGEDSVHPAFDVLLPVDGPLRFNACRYHNLHLYLREDWTSHANGAVRISRVYALVDEPGRFDYFATLFGKPALPAPCNARLFPSTDIALEIFDEAAAQAAFGSIAGLRPEGYVGYEILVESLDRMRACLEAGGVPFDVRGDRLCVAPEVGLGNIIFFAQA